MEFFIEVSEDKARKFNELLSLGKQSDVHEEGALVDEIEHSFQFNGDDYVISLALINDIIPYVEPVLYKRKGGEVYTEFDVADKSDELFTTFVFYIGDEEINLHVCD